MNNSNPINDVNIYIILHFIERKTSFFFTKTVNNLFLVGASNLFWLYVLNRRITVYTHFVPTLLPVPIVPLPELSAQIHHSTGVNLMRQVTYQV